MQEKYFTQIEEAPSKKRDVLVESDRPLTSKDIQPYLDDLVLRLKKQTEGKDTFLIFELSDEALLNAFFDYQPTFLKKVLGMFHLKTKHELMARREYTLLRKQVTKELKPQVGQLRALIMEELKKRLAMDPELEGVHLSDIKIVQRIPRIRKENSSATIVERGSGNYSLARVKDLNQRKEVLKKEKLLGEALSEFRKNHEQALRALAELPVQEHIFSFTRFDPTQGETLAQEVDLKTVPELLRQEEDPKVVLQVVRDCMLGALFLEKNGLVLQDISKENIGSRTVQGRRVGVLFDLEGLYPAYAMGKGRLTAPLYKLPEVAANPISPVEPSEMTYQFGVSLASLFSLTDLFPGRVDLQEEYTNLVRDMTIYKKDEEQPKKNRINLETAIERLEKLLKEL